jgi:hypothetical protein
VRGKENNSRKNKKKQMPMRGYLRVVKPAAEPWFNSPADLYNLWEKKESAQRKHLEEKEEKGGPPPHWKPREQPVNKSTNWRTWKKSDCENSSCTDDNKHDTHQAHNVDHSKEHKENVAMRHEIESMRKQMDAREKAQWGMGECYDNPSDNYPDNFQPIIEEIDQELHDVDGELHDVDDDVDGEIHDVEEKSMTLMEKFMTSNSTKDDFKPTIIQSNSTKDDFKPTRIQSKNLEIFSLHTALTESEKAESVCVNHASVPTKTNIMAPVSRVPEVVKCGQIAWTMRGIRLLKQSGAPKWFWEFVTACCTFYETVISLFKWLSWTWGECSLPWKWKKKCLYGVSSPMECLYEVPVNGVTVNGACMHWKCHFRTSRAGQAAPDKPFKYTGSVIQGHRRNEE